MFRARVLARTLSYVFFVTSTRTCFCWFFSNYLEDYVYTCTVRVPYCTRTVHCGVIRDFRKKKCTRTCTCTCTTLYSTCTVHVRVVYESTKVPSKVQYESTKVLSKVQYVCTLSSYFHFRTLYEICSGLISEDEA